VSAPAGGGLHELNAALAAELIRTGKVGAVEYARALISRQESLEPRIFALAHFEPERLLADAARCEEALRAARASGAAPPPLLGIPVGVKDNIDTAGVPTRAGSALHAGRVPREDAACLRALWKSGAYLHSKTVTTELAYFDPGPTRNPWHLAHTPGGSSSGSAAGISAGYFPLALGTQTAGSVIRPAAFCGVVGFVASQGRFPLDGILPFAPTVDQLGIFARSVEDVALTFGCLRGTPDGGGAAPADTGLSLAPLDRAPFLGLARKYFVEGAEDEVGRAAIHTAKHLHERGAIVHVVHLPESFSEVPAHHRVIMEVEMARAQRETYRAQPASYGKKLGELIEAGLKVPELDYRRALLHRERFQAEVAKLVRELDALLLPAAPTAALYGLESTGDPRFNLLWTNAGLPAITLPVSLSAAGLPLGIQLVGAPGADHHLLRVARYVEDRLPWGQKLAPVREEPVRSGPVRAS
jgi:Asp-tRNA(Asn)/Glu-tRNA(Gln) amidotransferase A subunit family amidase